MKTINVNLDDRSYPIYIGDSILSDKKLLSQYIKSNQIFIITNEKVAPLYLKTIEKKFVKSNCKVFILPDGELYKTLDSLNKIITKLIENKFSRTCVLVALGGGVIGDLTGFAASCYQRGVKFIQIPTTLLAQVDSSVGGKTAVNHPSGKNMIGAFYQPHAVFSDTSVLKTLDDRELSAGLAEVIKYGLIRDVKFFCWLEENIDLLISRDCDALEYAIERSCINKAEVVAIDEKETGYRAVLNLGHTFGHAIETSLSYKEWLHGEAVGCGMLIAADFSNRLGLLEKKQFNRIQLLIEHIGLPTKIHKNVKFNQILENMKVDKKSRDGVLHFVLLRNIGKAFLTSDYSEKKLKESIKEYFC